MEVVGVSIGGGKMEIVELNGFELKMTGNSPTLLGPHQDRYGAIAAVAGVLARHRINSGYMQVSRKEKGSEALMIIETCQPVEQEAPAAIAAQPGIEGATLFA